MRKPTAVLAALCLVATACGTSPQRSGGSAGDSTRYAADGTLTMAISPAPGSFNPYRELGPHGLGSLAYDSLVYQRPDGTFVSGLAEKWTADSRSASFTLRDGITCSDGTPLTASQVVAAIRFASNPKDPSTQLGVNIPPAPLTATADDTARTVKVVMTKQPYGFLLHTIGRLPIVCAKGLRDPAMLRTASDGTGPYVLSSVVPGQSFTFTVRKEYRWGPDGASTSAPGTPAKVVVRVVENETTASNLLLSGEVNLAKVTGQDRQRLEARGLKQVDWQTTGAWLSFNQQGGRATGDLRVRQALVRALDLGQVVKVSTGGSTRGASTGLLTIAPTGCAGDTVKGQLPAHDTATAERLLDQAGWTKGADGIRVKDGRQLSLNLLYLPVNSAYDTPTAELLARQWRAIGVAVKLTGSTFPALNEALFDTSNWDIYLGGWFFSLPSQLVGYLSGPVPPKGTNIAGVDNAAYNDLAAKAAAMTPPSACRYWNDAERAIFRNVDLVPVSNRTEHWFLNGAEAEMQRYNGPIPTTLRVLG